MRFPILIIVLLSAACGMNESPERLLEAADAAFLSHGDHGRAIDLYQKAIGTGALSDGERASAWLNLVRCKIMSKDFNGAVQRLDEMHAVQGDRMTHLVYCTIITELIEQEARTQAIDVLGKASVRFPDKQAIFEEQADQLRLLKPCSEELERLKGISYL